MKYKGKRIAVLLASGLLAIGSTGCSNASEKNIKGYQSKTSFTTFSEEKSDIKDDEIVDFEQDSKIKTFKKSLEKQFSDFDVTLDEKEDEFISSIYIDDSNVKVELIDGSTLEGDLKKFTAENINVENFYFMQSQFQEDYRNSVYQSYTDLVDAYKDKENKIELNFSNIKVNNECKYSDYKFEYQYDVLKSIDWNKCLDLSNCKKLWLNGVYLYSEQLQFINSLSSIETLIFTDTMLDDKVFYVSFDKKSLETLIFDISGTSSKINNIDISGCPNLKNLSIANVPIETLKNLTNLKNLEMLSFGLMSGIKSNDMLNNFEEEIDSIGYELDPSDEYFSKKNMNNFIGNIEEINNSNIKVLNISLLNCVNDKQLLDTIETLPNLKEIVGLEINNAEMCSEELIKYCDDHNIKHPFTEKSLEIKNELKRIISELITSDMDDFQKVDVLSKYILKKLYYDKKIIEESDTNPEMLKEGWGECLSGILTGKAICEGYSEITTALFREAGINCFKQQAYGHAYNLIYLDGCYYQLDLTDLDYVFEKENKSIDEENIKDYLIILGDKKSINSYEEPVFARMQRAVGGDIVWTEDDLAMLNSLYNQKDTQNKEEANVK